MPEYGILESGAKPKAKASGDVREGRSPHERAATIAVLADKFNLSPEEAEKLADFIMSTPRNGPNNLAGQIAPDVIARERQGELFEQRKALGGDSGALSPEILAEFLASKDPGKKQALVNKDALLKQREALGGVHSGNVAPPAGPPTMTTPMSEWPAQLEATAPAKGTLDDRIAAIREARRRALQQPIIDPTTRTPIQVK